MTVRVPSKGTHGVPYPKIMARLTNGLAVGRYKLGLGHAVRGMPTMILETRGARSGQVRQAIVGYLTQPPDSWLVVASSAGATWNPGWLHNLAKDADATIDFGKGRRIAVRAETLVGQELDAGWQRFAAEAHQYAAYRSKTDREIAIVRLRERPAA